MACGKMDDGLFVYLYKYIGASVYLQKKVCLYKETIFLTLIKSGSRKTVQYWGPLRFDLPV
jgi:hypothetical protein